MPWELVSLAIPCALLALTGLLLGAACGAPIVALCSQALARLNHNKFLYNFALQLCRTGLVCVLLYLLLAGALLSCFLQVPLHFWPAAVPLQAIYLPAAALGWGIALLLLTNLTWKKLKQKKGLRLLLTLLSSLGFWLFAYTGLILKLKILALPDDQEVLLQAWNQILWPRDPYLFGILFFQFLCLALGAAGIGGMLYILLRRSKEDFGRDYYRFAQPQAAKWSLLFILQGPGWIWYFFSLRSWPELLQAQSEQLLAAGALLALVLSLACSLQVLQSKQPMRRKLSPILSAFLAWMGLSGICLSYLWGLLQPWQGQ